jgi:hypothetical protein
MLPDAPGLSHSLPAVNCDFGIRFDWDNNQHGYWRARTLLFRRKASTEVLGYFHLSLRDRVPITKTTGGVPGLVLW